MIATSPMLHLSSERITSPSRPAMAAASAAIAKCCGESILASTPPVLFPAASSVGESPASCAAATCRSAEQRVRRRNRTGAGDAEPAEGLAALVAAGSDAVRPVGVGALGDRFDQ